jgi:hypothetical protein
MNMIDCFQKAKKILANEQNWDKLSEHQKDVLIYSLLLDNRCNFDIFIKAYQIVIDVDYFQIKDILIIGSHDKALELFDVSIKLTKNIIFQ